MNVKLTGIRIDRDYHVTIYFNILFQFTPPRGGDIRDNADFFIIPNVSIHAPARGRHAALPAFRATVRFNSRPREGATRTP